MAFNLTVTQDDGSAATYWRIGSITIDRLSGCAHVEMCGYITQALRESGSCPAVTQTAHLPGAIFAGVSEGTNATAQAYVAVMAMPQYAGCVAS
jgi:hypothetical protein